MVDVEGIDAKLKIEDRYDGWDIPYIVRYVMGKGSYCFLYEVTPFLVVRYGLVTVTLITSLHDITHERIYVHHITSPPTPSPTWQDEP